MGLRNGFVEVVGSSEWWVWWMGSSEWVWRMGFLGFQVSGMEGTTKLEGTTHRCFRHCSTNELGLGWVEDEIGFGWIGLGWWRSRWRHRWTSSGTMGAILPVLGATRWCFWWIGLAFSLSLSLSLSLFAHLKLGPKMVWSENMNGNDFTGVLGYFTVKGEKHFSWLNLLVQPNTQVLRKSISGSNLNPKQTQPKLNVGP